jgi:hypothetical protein
MEDWKDPSIIIAGDTLEDFCYFYSLSKLRNRVYWLPTSIIQKYKNKKSILRSNSKLNEFLATYTLILLGGLALERRNTDVFFASFSKDKKELNNIINRIKRHVLIKPLNLNFSIKDSLFDLLPYTLKVFEINNFRNFDILLDDKNRSISKIETATPKNFMPKGNRFLWLTELFIKDYSLPNRRCFNEHLFYSWNKPKAIVKNDFRVTNTGVIYNSNSHLYIPSLDIESMLMKPYFYQMNPVEIFRVLFTSQGYNFNLSDKGIYFNEIVNLFSEYDDFFSFFEDLGNQVLLENISNIKLGDGIGLSSDKRKYYSLKELKKQLKLTKQKFKERINYYISKNIFQRGLILKCERCRNTAWYNLEKLTNYFKCERCDKKQRFISNHYLTKNEPEWHYKLNEVIFQGISNNILVPILTLNYFRRQKKKSFIILGDCEVSKNDKKFEIDINCILDGKLIIGECKSSDTIPKKQIKKYIRLTKELKIDILVFSTTEHKWNKSTLKELKEQKKKLKKHGIRVEILNRKQLYAF